MALDNVVLTWYSRIMEHNEKVNKGSNNREGKGMKDNQINTIKKIVHNTMDFCGNSIEAVKEYCMEEGIVYDQNIEKLVFEAQMSYSGTL